MSESVKKPGEKMKQGVRQVGHLYHPETLKQKGLLWSSMLLLVTAIVLLGLLGWFWSQEPDAPNVQLITSKYVDESNQRVVGASYTGTLIVLGETLLDKRGGYLSNDVMPPGVWLDNIPNWEFGVLVVLRDASAALRNHFSRSQSQSIEDKSLSRAEPQFNFQNDSWIFPTTEGEYRDGLKELENYIMRLVDPQQQKAQFYARADNLRQFLEIIEKRLGSLSQRLSASVGQERVNTDLAGDSDARQSTSVPGTLRIKTPWLELDDVFYEARGASWALRAMLQAIEVDFDSILRKKNAVISLRQIIRELDGTQQSILSPVVLNGGGFGLFSNYSLTMANYISRANAAVIDLRSLLERG